MKILATMAVAVAAPGGAFAAAASNTPEGVVREVIGCSRIEDPFARLRCYDSAAGLVQPGYAPPPAPAASAPMAAGPASPGPAPAPARPQARGGAPAPGAPAPYTALATPPSAPEGDHAAAIVSATLDQARNLVLVLDDGATYRQQDGRVMDPPPRPGTQVQVRRGAFRAYFIEIPGQRAVRFQRLGR